MVEIYSPTNKEDELGSFIAKQMAELGFNVEKDLVGNIVGKIGKGHPRILLCGHMDTIPNKLPVELREGILYGRGTSDAKGALAAMIVAASQLGKEEFKGEILVVGAVDEEGNSRGVKHLAKTQTDIDYAIFGEPTNTDTLTIGYKGGLLLKISCETTTGHSSAPWLFENSIEKIMEIWKLINNYNSPKENPESRFYSISKCLIRVEGGEKGSVVPQRCEMIIDMRIPPPLSTSEVREEVFNMIKDYQKKNPNTKIQFKAIGETDPYIADKKTVLVKAFTQAIWDLRKIRVKLVKKTGTGDMNEYGMITGVPVITYGPGDPHLDHSPNEHIRIDEYLKSIYIIIEALEKLQTLHFTS